MYLDCDYVYSILMYSSDRFFLRTFGVLYISLGFVFWFVSVMNNEYKFRHSERKGIGECTKNMLLGVNSLEHLCFSCRTDIVNLSP